MIPKLFQYVMLPPKGRIDALENIAQIAAAL
jgi:hypothetical protein